MDTGTSMKEITPEYLMQFTDIVSIVRKIIQQWKRLSLPHLAKHFCDQPKTSTRCRDYTSPDKCVFGPDDVLQLMSCASPGDKQQHLPDTATSEEELLRQEVDKSAPSNNSDRDLIPLGWQQIYTLLVTMLWKVVPDELWGSPHNQKVMFKAIKTIIKLGCHDKLFLGQVIRGIKHKHLK